MDVISNYGSCLHLPFLLQWCLRLNCLRFSLCFSDVISFAVFHFFLFFFFWSHHVDVQHHSNRHLQCDLVLSSGKETENCFYFTSQWIQQITHSFISCCPIIICLSGPVWLAVMIDFLIVEENSPLNNCSQQNGTTSYGVQPFPGGKTQE